MTDDYPVREIALGLVPRRGLGLIPARRNPATLPAQQPGVALIFSTGDKWQVARGAIAGTESYVTSAVSVSVVQTREKDIEVDVPIPSNSHIDEFTVRCRFQCQVTDPVVAAQRGPIDLVKMLQNFLRADRGLLVKGQETDIGDVRELRIKVDARVRAWCRETTPNIPGLRVTLESVEVLTPIAMIEHLRGLRDAQWARQLAVLLGSYEDEDATALAEKITQPAYVRALGVIRDKIDLQKLADDVHADQATKDANILELLRVLEKNGQLDQLPFDGRILVNTLVSRLAGASKDALPAGSATAEIGLRSADLRKLESTNSSKEGRFAIKDAD
ncbi:hypothetical protein AB0M46_15445 [Dactylosporangium sp. NPDC051485]|uniref:hypothetical protein n=1 Tax=Dactylosporangium sp. NPDC051485 TaxID=3154846 RepID=UPI0034207D67